MCELPGPQTLPEALLWTPEPTGGETLVHALFVRLLAGQAWNSLGWTGPAHYRAVRVLLQAPLEERTERWTNRANALLDWPPEGAKWLSRMSPRELKELRRSVDWHLVAGSLEELWKNRKEMPRRG